MLTAIYSQKRHHDEGFTLLELLIVVIVIGILAAIALPIFLNQQKAAIDAAVKSDVRNTAAQVVGWRAQHASDVPNSSEAYVAEGGRVTTSKGTYIDVEFTSTDAYTVCGYNPGGNLADHAHAWKYDGATGHFAASVADCANAVHVRASATDTSGDAAGTNTTDVVTMPVTYGVGASSASGGSTGSGSGATGTGSDAAETTTVIAYDPAGTTTITPGSGGNSGLSSRRGTDPRPPAAPVITDPGPGGNTGGGSNPSTSPTPTTSPTATPTPTATPILASPGGTTLNPYTVGTGNPSCSYAVAPAITSTFIDKYCHKVHVQSVRSVTVNGIKDFQFVYEFDHDDACEAAGIAAGYDKDAYGNPKNMDANGYPCDWLQIGGHDAATSVNASYGYYYFDYYTQPKSWYGANGSPEYYPCAMPVFYTNYQKYAFDTCMTDHGWKP